MNQINTNPHQDAYLTYVEARQKRQKLNLVRYVILFVLSLALIYATLGGSS